MFWLSFWHLTSFKAKMNLSMDLFDAFVNSICGQFAAWMATITQICAQPCAKKRWLLVDNVVLVPRPQTALISTMNPLISIQPLLQCLHFWTTHLSLSPPPTIKMRAMIRWLTHRFLPLLRRIVKMDRIAIVRKIMNPCVETIIPPTVTIANWIVLESISPARVNVRVVPVLMTRAFF